MKRLVQDARQIGDGFHQIIVFGAGPGDADGVAFLERVVADEMRRHLSGDDDDRYRIAQRVGEPGDRIGRARSRRHQNGADLAGRARIALGGMHRALFVPHQDVLHLILLEQGVVDRQYRAARIAENVLDPLIGKRRYHHLRTGHFSHSPLRSFGPWRTFHRAGEVLSVSSPACREGRGISGNKKGPLKAPGSRTATFAGGIIHPRRCASIRGSAKQKSARL